MIYIIFLVSLGAVSKGADWLVEGAVALATAWGISQIIVGATIVSLGTTLPEALISAFASAQGKGDVIVGTVLGSILFNTAVILGLAATISPPRINDRDTFFKAGSMAGVLILFALLASDHYISRGNSLFLGLILLLYLGSNMWNSMNNANQEKKKSSRQELLPHILLLILGSVLVVLGAHFLLESGVEIARILKVPESVIAVTLFAVGSSLPELSTGITAALKGHTDLVLGNVIGANTLNIVFVIALAGLIKPFAVAASALKVDIPIGLLVMGIFFIPALATKRLSRWQGAATILAYLLYMLFVFGKL